MTCRWPFSRGKTGPVARGEPASYAPEPCSNADIGAACVYVCVRARERERARDSVSARESESESEGGREGGGEGGGEGGRERARDEREQMREKAFCSRRSLYLSLCACMRVSKNSYLL